jgi:NAD(P)-dependent dehydrogenase (short-subunit alcohol dehydrogenase family)
MSHPVLTPGRVAVVTGAASGIGLAACKRFASLGMRVCMADIDGEELRRSRDAVAVIAAHGDNDVLACAVDVSQAAHVERLQHEVESAFGEVALLMNNAAGFFLGRAFRDLEAWQRTFAVNLMGIVHGLQVFVPRMIEQGTPCLVVNTGSKQGITNPPGNAAYNAAKAAVKSLTEGLQHELRNTAGCRVTAHLLVPGWTTTGRREHHPGAWLPEQVAEHLVAALERGDFYILCPDNEVTPEMDRKRILWGALDVTENRPPLSRWHPEYAKEFEAFEP